MSAAVKRTFLMNRVSATRAAKRLKQCETTRISHDVGTVPDTPAKFGAAGHRWKAKHLKILFNKKSEAKAVETNLDAAEVVSGSNQATIFRPVSANDM